MLEIKSDGIVFKKLTGDKTEYYINATSGDTNLNVDLNNKTINNLTVNNLRSSKILLNKINLEQKLNALDENDQNIFQQLDYQENYNRQNDEIILEINKQIQEAKIFSQELQSEIGNLKLFDDIVNQKLIEQQEYNKIND